MIGVSPAGALVSASKTCADTVTRIGLGPCAPPKLAESTSALILNQGPLETYCPHLSTYISATATRLNLESGRGGETSSEALSRRISRGCQGRLGYNNYGNGPTTLLFRGS